MSIPHVVDGETDLDSLLFNPIIDRVNEQGDTISNMRTGVYNVSDYDDVQDAFDDADQNGVVAFPPGTHTVDTINYRGQSIIGAGSNLTTIKGLPGKDVFHVDPTLGQYARTGPRVSGIKIVVDDSVDASSSFPDRDGVGNAGWALDYPDGSANSPLTASRPIWSDVLFYGLSDAVGGQNKSCGIYEQSHMSLGASYDHLAFYRLEYGWQQDCPRSNLPSTEIARDMVSIGNLYFNGCANPWRIHNGAWWNVGLVSIHAWTNYGITFASDQTVSRGANFSMNFGTVYMETGNHAFGWDGAAIYVTINNLTLLLSEPVVWGGKNGRIRTASINVDDAPATILTITGDRNEIEFSGNGGSLTSPIMVDDQGSGNQAWITYFQNDANAVTDKRPLLQDVYTASNVSTDRSFDANSTTTDELADVLGTLIADLREMGVVR